MHPNRMALALLLVGSFAPAQTPAAPKAAADKAPTTSQVLERQLAGLEREFVPAAEAMPEAAFDFAPTTGEFKGVKTFAQQVRHVASANFMFSAGILGEKPPVDLGGENGPEDLKTKAEVIKYLKDSFTFAHRAFGGITLYLASLTVAHAFDHYGQMAVYLRMNGIIPPASRKP